MDSARFFQELLDYNHYCNRKLIDLLVENRTSLPDQVLKLSSHIVNAHHIWNRRMELEVLEVDVWDIHPIDLLKEMDRKNHEASVKVLNEIPLNSVVTYTNTLGKSYANSVRDILFQIINHSTHHRAQISIGLREAGITPLAQDYIFYKR